MTKMSKLGCLPGATLKSRFTPSLNRFVWLLVAAAFLAFLPPHALAQDDEYLRILDLVDEADAMNTNGPPGPVVAKFQEAQNALRSFQKAYPEWNTKVVSYRLNYIASKLAAFSHDNSTSSSGTSASAESTGSKAPQVKLLEPGAEPRKVLRLHPKPGDKQTLTLTIKMNMGTKIGDMDSPAVKLPGTTMVMDSTVKSISATGDITYEMVMADASVADEPGVMPQVAEAMKGSMAGLKGLSGTGTTSNRGLNLGTNFKVPAGADPQTRQAIEQMKESVANLSCPLPEEAIGPGAKWTARTTLSSQGMTIDQTATYQLASIDGERLNLKTTIAQSAANQKMQNPSMPGVKLDLSKLTGEGTGEVTSDLTQLLPREATIESHTDLSLTMNMGGQKQAMTMKLDLTLRLETK